MDELTICGISALRYYRCPPQVLGCYSPLNTSTRNARREIANHSLVTEIIGPKVSVLVRERSQRAGAHTLKPCLWTGEYPLGHTRQTDHGFSIVSPEVALLQIANKVSQTHLAMMLYEFCGWFSVFQPSARFDCELLASADLGLGCEAWRRVSNRQGKPTNLWQRPPLVDIRSLHAFSNSMKGRRGQTYLARALECVTGIVASPFEAQVSMLLSLPRKRGGESLACFENNAEVRLTQQARALSGMARCYVDLLFDGVEQGNCVAIECQGSIAHGRGGLTDGDANRMVALESMGIDVIPITYAQISSSERFEALVRMLKDRLGVPYREKGPGLRDAEIQLRSELFCDWAGLLR